MLNEGKKIGFVGAGNMASAIFCGWVKSGAVSPSDLTVTDISPAKLESAAKIGISTLPNQPDSNLGAQAVAASSDVLVLAVKPQYARPVLDAIGPLGNEKLVISIMGGVESSFVEGFTGQARVVRVMPNTPMLVLEGCAGIAKGQTASLEDEAFVARLFEALGIAVALEERLMDSLTAVSGCGPAFAYIFIEALAEGGVALGLPFEHSLRIAAETLLGAAKMVLETGRHPASLKDDVMSPGGSTAAGVAVLEERAYRFSIMAAAMRAKEKMEEVGRNA
ncbi:MAG: pyrroline-5-carboxylate reductase [Eubacteriaceae bacterium]|jgi:pyrroline-5-carboxylate reductase|nr:pyrroline-5-carboxylate reductase [Eubacteriaceae bacterium]